MRVRSYVFTIASICIVVTLLVFTAAWNQREDLHPRSTWVPMWQDGNARGKKGTKRKNAATVAAPALAASPARNAEHKTRAKKGAKRTGAATTAAPASALSPPRNAEEMFSRDRFICHYNNSFGGTSRIVSKKATYVTMDTNGRKIFHARRGIHMTGYKVPTNLLQCEVHEDDFQEGMCIEPPGLLENPPTKCPPCPCKMNSTRTASGSKYTLKLCFRVRDQGCKPQSGVIIGFGIGTLSMCLAENCPNMKLTTVDIDPGVGVIGERFFGWSNQTSLHVGDATEFFEDAATRGQTFDLVAVDCFAVAKVPEACRSEGFFVSIGKALAQNGGLFAQNVMKRGKPWEEDIRKHIGNDGAEYSQYSQWFMLQRAGDKQSEQ